MGHSHSHLFGVRTTFFRFFTVYGPWGQPDMTLFKFARAILADEAIIRAHIPRHHRGQSTMQNRARSASTIDRGPGGSEIFNVSLDDRGWFASLLGFQTTGNRLMDDPMQVVEDLLDILQCPTCRSDRLRIQQAQKVVLLKDIELSPRELKCEVCDEHYPISREGIPILWTPDIKKYLGFCENNLISAKTALSANIEVYDQISDHYLEHVRKDDAASSRFMACIKSIDSKIANSFPIGGWHVDFGCGPGHVLIWTQDWATSRKIKQVGLDVSIENLRNVMSKTNAFVVLGDAIRMPFKSGVASLVTEASVLHHIEDWTASVSESCRILHTDGAIVYDNEPTKDQLDWSPLAKWIFEMRFLGYKLLSYIVKSKQNFRSMKLAKLNYYNAEVHNQPGRGFDPNDVERAFKAGGRNASIYLRAGNDLVTGSGRNTPQIDFLLFLSTRDWRNPQRGIITLIAT